MTQTRVYLPLTVASLRRLVADREAGPAPLRAYAVTVRLERAYDAGEREEELEFAALVEAFDEAGRLAEAAGGGPARRVVAAADVAPELVEPDPSGEGAGAVVLAQPVPLRQIVSVHVDETAGDDGVDDVLWFDVTEVDQLLAELG